MKTITDEKLAVSGLVPLASTIPGQVFYDETYGICMRLETDAKRRCPKDAIDAVQLAEGRLLFNLPGSRMVRPIKAELHHQPVE